VGVVAPGGEKIYIFCYRIGTFSAVVEIEVQNTSFSKERNHKPETN